MQRRFGQVRCLEYRAYLFVYSADSESEPTSDRKPLTFTEVYLGHVDIADFRKKKQEANSVLMIRRSQVRSLVGEPSGCKTGHQCSARLTDLKNCVICPSLPERVALYPQAPVLLRRGPWRHAEPINLG